MPSKVVAVSRGWRRRRIFTLVSATDPPWSIRTTFRLKPFTYNQASTPYLKDGGFYTPLFVWRLEFVLTREGHSLHSKYAGAKARLHSSSIDHSGRTTCLRSRKSATSRAVILRGKRSGDFHQPSAGTFTPLVQDRLPKLLYPFHGSALDHLRRDSLSFMVS
jgi:hypothetical protein